MAICLCVISSTLCMGQNVKIYDTSNSGLIDNDLWAVVVDHDGNKWLGTLKYGLIKFDGDTFTVFNKENSAIKGDCVTSLFVDSKGNLWAEYSRPDEGIVMYNGNEWTTFKAAIRVLTYFIIFFRFRIRGENTNFSGNRYTSNSFYLRKSSLKI